MTQWVCFYCISRRGPTISSKLGVQFLRPGYYYHSTVKNRQVYPVWCSRLHNYTLFIKKLRKKLGVRPNFWGPNPLTSDSSVVAPMISCITDGCWCRLEVYYDVKHCIRCVLENTAKRSSFFWPTCVNAEGVSSCYWVVDEGHIGWCVVQSVSTWSSDMHFGAQRLIGCNPLMVKLCTQLPEKYVYNNNNNHNWLGMWPSCVRWPTHTWPQQLL